MKATIIILILTIAACSKQETCVCYGEQTDKRFNVQEEDAALFCNSRAHYLSLSDSTVTCYVR